VQPGRAADHSPPSSVAVMEEYSYTSTHPLGHTGPVTGSLYLFLYAIRIKELLNRHPNDSTIRATKKSTFILQNGQSIAETSTHKKIKNSEAFVIIKKLRFYDQRD